MSVEGGRIGVRLVWFRSSAKVLRSSVFKGSLARNVGPETCVLACMPCLVFGAVYVFGDRCKRFVTLGTSDTFSSARKAQYFVHVAKTKRHAWEEMRGGLRGHFSWQAQ